MEPYKQPLYLRAYQRPRKSSNEEHPQALQHSTELVQLADRLGYERYWFAEHHNTKYQMSTSPELLSAHAAALTFICYLLLLAYSVY